MISLSSNPSRARLSSLIRRAGVISWDLATINIPYSFLISCSTIIPTASFRVETLRNAILDGRLPCGLALRQQELATLFGVSRMPVREALRQLEAQELLHVVHHKGAVVAPLIVDNSIEAYDLRILLETEALRLSVPLLEERDFQQIETGGSMIQDIWENVE